MAAREYEFLLFDLDGTLVDVEFDYARRVLSRVGDRLGLSLTDGQIDALWYGAGGSRDALLREMGVTPDRFWALFHEEEDPVARARSTYLYDDAAVVGEIDAPVGLVTHCQRYLADPVLDRLDIRDWFDAVVCCTEETGWKPDPTPVQMAMDGLGVEGRAGAMIGDSPDDVGAAWNAGLDGIHVRRHDPSARGQCVLGDHRLERLDREPLLAFRMANN